MISGTYLHSTPSYFIKFELLTTKILKRYSNRKIVQSCGPKLPKRPLKYATGGLKIKKENFISGSSRFMASINRTGRAEGALMPVILRITHWTSLRRIRGWGKKIRAKNIVEQGCMRPLCKLATCTRHIFL